NQHYRHNYGQLLILNAGGGYHVLLAGMERISVRLGAVRGNGRARRSDGRRSPMGPCQTGGANQPVFRRTGSLRSRPMVGCKRSPEGWRMMTRKPSLILLGAAAGVALTLIAPQPRIVLNGARAQTAAADTYRQLSLFGDVFERVRADYVEKPNDGKLIE